MCAKPSSKIVALWCWYHGAAFRGYQSQLVGPTVQDTLLAALTRAGYQRKPVAAGRTDAGVHARMQVLSLRVVEGGSAEEVAPRLNAELPRDVLGIVCSRPAKPKFHAAWAATGKRYRYRLATRPSARWEHAAWRVDVDMGRVAELLRRFEGTHDFSAFHAKGSAVKPRTITHARLVELSDGAFEARFEGDGFGRYMIRFIMGTVVDVARGALAEETMLAGLERAQPFVRARAPAHGLTLWEVLYPRDADPFTEADRASAVPLFAAAER